MSEVIAGQARLMFHNSAKFLGSFKPHKFEQGFTFCDCLWYFESRASFFGVSGLLHAGFTGRALTQASRRVLGFGG